MSIRNMAALVFYCVYLYTRQFEKIGKWQQFG